MRLFQVFIKLALLLSLNRGLYGLHGLRGFYSKVGKYVYTCSTGC